MALPILVVEPVVVARIAPEVDVEPEAVIGPLALFEHFPEGREGTADVIEHAVQHDADARLVELLDERLKFLVGAETAVDTIKVNGVVAVALALKERIEEHRPHPELLEAGDLRLDEGEAVAHLAEVVLPLRPAESERIDLIKHTFVKPHNGISLHFLQSHRRL